MAAANPVRSLQEEAMCCVCLGYYQNPVSTECGHSFCRLCTPKGRVFPCPQCRVQCDPRALKANTQLQNIVEIAKQLCQRTEGAQGLCQQHEEKLQLFCKVEEAAICVVCSLSAEHRDHAAVPIREAALEYKDTLAGWLPPLRAKKELLVATKAQEEGELKALRDNLEAEKTKTLAEFQQLRQRLREQEDAALARLEEMHSKITRTEKANTVKRLQQIISLDALIREVTSKCAQPTEELLKDVRGTLRKCEHETFQEQEKTTNEDKRKESLLNHVNVFEPEMGMRQYKVPVTLDGDTAHGELLQLSENMRRVRGLVEVVPFDSYNYPTCFQYPCALGKEGVRAGRHYWELQLLLEGEGWCVGVALESVNRGVADSKSPEQGVWAVEGYHGHYTALTSPATPLPLRETPRLLGVYLDYEEGRVSLYKADTKDSEHLYTFTGAAFTETIFPYFYLCPGAELRLV
ncbi:E3 ubiquitin-protein ligase TRIM39-like [Lissotriton helveticus]